MSMASPLHPKDPNTPQGFRRELSLSAMIAPRASCTGVGMCPPRVGLPSTKPSQRFISSLTCKGMDGRDGVEREVGGSRMK